jgi:hypothetical protein
MTKRLAMAPSRAVGVLASVALALGLAQSAQAGNIFASSNMFSGSLSADFSFNVPGPGSLIVSLSSINDGSWVGADLDLSLDTPKGVLESASGISGIDQFAPIQVYGPETLFLNVLGQATGSIGGLYSVDVAFQPSGSTVPLPSSAWLLLAGLAAAGGILRFKASLPRAN